jgi:beta-phosphoglucomutase-like phosphatase (HAD superfamily)
MLRAVIFDLDGVIVDSHPAHLQAWKTLLHSLEKNVSENDLQFVMEGYKREVILRHFLGELSADDVNYYGAKKDALFRDSLQDIKTVPGFTTFFDSVQRAGLPVALASSASRWRAEHTLTCLGLARAFRAIITGDDVAEGKPDPAIFQAAARGLGADPAEILVCEDAVAGVEAAKSAGMKCLAIAANGRRPLLKEAGADLVVGDFTEASLPKLRNIFENGSPR